MAVILTVLCVRQQETWDQMSKHVWHFDRLLCIMFMYWWHYLAWL